MKLKKTLFVALCLALCGGRRPCPAQGGRNCLGHRPGCPLGIPERNTVELMPGDRRAESHPRRPDDASTPPARSRTSASWSPRTRSTSCWASTTAQPAGMIDVAAESQTLMIAWAASSRIVEPADEKRRWVFKTPQNDLHVDRDRLPHDEQQRQERGLHRVSLTPGEGW